MEQLLRRDIDTGVIIRGLVAGLAGTRLGRRGRRYVMAAVCVLGCISPYAAFASNTLAMWIAALSVAGFFIHAG